MATKQVALDAAWPQERAKSDTIAWPIWASVVGVTSAIIGGHWDISWHRSIGRDDFWTPPHLAIYMCGILAGLSCAWLILRTTFDKATAALNDTVKIWGFRGPLGAFIIAWGGVAMLTSVPFDDWWHSAYGLDTKILSPPHVLLILGIFGIQTGTLMLILGQMNRAEGERRKLLEKLFLYVGGMILCLMMILILEFTSRTLQHSPLFYRAVALTAAPVLVGVAHASRHRWGATIAASIYTAVMLGLIWILPLFPASPKLGPVYNMVTHLVPPQFPVLLIVPALVIDWLRAAIAWRGLKPWAHSLLLGAVFVAVLIAAQWPFANFLMSDGAKNWFFGAHYFDYSEGPQRLIRRGLFYAFEKTPAEFWQAMGIAVACSVLMTRLGLAWGNWMRQIVR